MLWTMLLAICFLSSLLSAVKATEHTLLGYTIAIVAASVPGGCCVWAPSAIINAVEAKTSGSSPGRQNWYFGMLYVLTLGWMMFAIPDGEWATKVLVRFLK